MGHIAMDPTPAVAALTMPEIMAQGYAALRGDLFNGFLSLGGFLLTMLTFIVVTMKEQVYDVPSYQDEKDDERQPKPVSSIYAPLRRFGGFLVASIALSLVAAGWHFGAGIIGGIPTCPVWVAVVGIVISILAVLALLVSLKACAENLSSIYKQGERDCKRRRDRDHKRQQRRDERSARRQAAQALTGLEVRPSPAPSGDAGTAPPEPQAVPLGAGTPQ
jgi:hypothetical protein